MRRIPGLDETEEAFERTLEETAEALGWKVYHTRYSLRSKKGFPDVVMARPGRGGSRGRVIFAELKSARGSVSDDQADWLAVLERCPGVEVYVWQPHQWPEIEACLKRA
jgi:VRR-NUC domain-containing protein